MLVVQAFLTPDLANQLWPRRVRRVAPPIPGTSQLWRLPLLSERQQSLYRHRVEIWRPARGIDHRGRPTPKGWTLLASEVPCYFQTGIQFQGPKGFILAEGDNLLTTDSVHMPHGIDIKAGDCLKMTEGPSAGAYWMVRGDPRHRNIHADKQMVECTRSEAAPTGIE